MKKVILPYLLLFLFLGLANNSTSHQYESHTELAEASDADLEFIANLGQWHPLIRYKAEIPYGAIYLENDAIHYDLYHPEDYNRIHNQIHHRQVLNEQDPGMRKHSIRIRFPNVEYSPGIVEMDHLEHYYNYFLGSDPKRWQGGIHPSSRLMYRNLYTGIDLLIEGKGGMKYSWIVHKPNPETLGSLWVEIEGAEKIYTDQGTLVMETSCGKLFEEAPVAWQTTGDLMVAVPCEFEVSGNKVYYRITGDVDPSKALYLDPKLIFSTYSGSKGDNFGFTATYDSRGNLYAGGIVDAEGTDNYPVSSGAYDVSWNGGVGRFPVNLPSDISISKYDSSGNQLLWATYLGGNDDEHPHSLVVNRNDELILMGTSYSHNFPTTKGAYDTLHGLGTNLDIVVCKFSKDGKNLLGSTYVGGDNHDGFIPDGNILQYNYADNFRGDVIPDDDNHIFVATCTLSDSVEIVNGFQKTKNNSLDGLAFELNENLTNLEWSSFMGGNGMDALYSVKLDQNNIYFGGATTSTDLEASDSALQKNHAGNVDGLLLRVNKDSRDLKSLSYWGTSQYDQIYFVDLDDEGNVYATGQTEGEITKSLGIYGEDNRGQFIFKIDSGFSALEWKTTFGNTDRTPNLVPSAFLVDVCGHIYFSGWAVHSYDGSRPGTSNMEFTFDAVQDQTDNQDFYIMVLDKDASNLLYATYFGGDSTGDHVDGGTSRFDKRGVIYQSVCSSCPGANDIAVATREINDFPTTPNSAFPINVSVRCSNASFKIDLQIKSAVIADFSANPTVGCKPLGVQFTNRSVLGDTLFWDFGDGSGSSEINPFHEFPEPGVYEVTLTVIDSNTCNISDEHKRTVLVLDKGNAAFEVQYNPCSNELQFENNSEGAFSYRWDFGNGDQSTERIPDYTYEESGLYTILLIINEQSLCADTFMRVVNVSLIGAQYLLLYNVFTPNEDGLNDCFRFDGLETICNDIQWTVYNRWGEIVFRTDNPNACWNGKVENLYQELPEGIYYYVLDLNKNSISSQDLVSGSITLLR